MMVLTARARASKSDDSDAAISTNNGNHSDSDSDSKTKGGADENNTANVVNNLHLLLPPPSICVFRTAILVWEMAAPNTLLVATAVCCVIWPGLLRAGKDRNNWQMLLVLRVHNGNVLLALTEISLTGGLPVRWSEVSLGPLLGIAYVVFSWNMTDKLNTKQHGPQFIHFSLIPRWVYHLVRFRGIAGGITDILRHVRVGRTHFDIQR
jgi:hypothetical protein